LGVGVDLETIASGVRGVVVPAKQFFVARREERATAGKRSNERSRGCRAPVTMLTRVSLHERSHRGNGAHGGL
jgi:hypothetical protein